MKNTGNILLVANWESNVGYAWWLMENFWVQIEQHFHEQGRSCHLIYPKVTQVPADINASGIIVEQCDFRDQSTQNLTRIRDIIKHNNIQIIYLSDSPTYSMFYLRLKLWGVKKIIVHDHTPGDRTTPSGIRRLLKSLLHRLPLISADHFIAVTDFVYQRFINVYCLPEKKCSVAANGIKPIELDKSDRHYINSIFDIPENRFTVITTGRASQYKGIDFFIECADELINKQHIENLHFLFCGDGPDMAMFKNIAAQNNLDSHFTFAGKRTDIRQILPSCNIGFHAATGEVGYSLSILEYMSAGLLTIVPDQPSTSLCITDEVNGLLYKPRDIRSACNAIKKSMDTQKIKDIGERAVSSVKENYDIAQTNRTLIHIFEQVMLD